MYFLTESWAQHVVLLSHTVIYHSKVFGFGFGYLESQGLAGDISHLQKLSLLCILEAKNELFGVEADSLLILGGKFGFDHKAVVESLV